MGIMERGSTFSAKVKDELARVYPEKDCCRLAELAAITRLDGSVIIGSDDSVGLRITTEYSAAARKIYRLLKDRFGVEGEVTVIRQNRLKKRAQYRITVKPSDKTPGILRILGLLSAGGHIRPGIKKDLIKNKCCCQSYLRGVFLGCGSVSGLDSGYHLELTADSERLGGDIADLINRFPSLQAKLIRRKQACLVYLKESSQIADFLTIVGAHGSLLEFENARVLKGVKNQVNRIVNCETANIGKTADAAVKQIQSIRLIDERLGLDILESTLAQVARLRLENPESNLKELGEIMTPPLGKSGVNHRFRKLIDFAQNLRDMTDRTDARTE